MSIHFWKMHGAGNDFILVDDRLQTFPADNKDFIERLARRRTGVGCEGLILLRASDQADFRMMFFNPDGREAEMCGNGARCVARLANDIGLAPKTMSFDTRAGLLRAEITATDRVKLWMTAPKDWRLDNSLQVGDLELTCHFVNSGVPHAVIPVNRLADTDVGLLGRAIRRHAAFVPEGTNANFFEVTGPAAVAIRTYERGVESETLACGTGIVATGLIAGRLGLVSAPVTVRSAGGDDLTVDYRLTREGAEDLTLEGPAEHVFTGELPCST